MTIYEEGRIGRIEVSTVKFPNYVERPDATYTYSGKVLVSYKTKADNNIPDFYNLAVLNDDGTGFRRIFSGEIPEHEKANGIRYMPFRDNKRILLGDYVLECTPDIDHCTSAELIPVIYPKGMEEIKYVTFHWSEIIIAPDNEHISWTMLRSDNGAAALLGILVRKEGSYVIENAQIISTIRNFVNDQEKEGFIIPQTMRGGEVKQFVRGGKAISLVGSKEGNSTNSVIQSLDSEELMQITYTPGYDETTILSPDEQLGLVMSTRGSKTDPAIFGLVPRPYGTYTAAGALPQFLYLYAVTGVRAFRKGNIGPVLIDIERSIKEKGYKGVKLHDPDDEWVYCSPMSWNPDGKRAMWQEMLRGSEQAEGGILRRVRKVELPDYEPQEPVPFERTPDDIPYGIKDISVLESPISTDAEGKIAGKYCGYIDYSRKGSGCTGTVYTGYENFNDDGKSFYNGYERLAYDYTAESCYEADIKLTGADEGEVKCRATFSSIAGYQPARLLFEEAEDGKPKSYGYASYHGITLNMEDLLE